MNHETKVNTSPTNEQANVVNATLLFSTIRQQIGDVESQAKAAEALCEVCYDELDAMAPLGVATARLDALIKATHRNVLLIQESVRVTGALLLEAQVTA